MMKELQKIQQKAGVELDAAGNPLSFGNDEEALTAAREGVALCDRSHWGLLQISGEDRLRYLHNQSTNDFNRLQPGQGCDTVFVTSTGRTLDLATAYVTEDAVLVLVSPNRRQQLFEWLDRFIFPFDKVELVDLEAKYAVFSLIGSKSDSLLQQLAIEAIIGRSQYDHQLVNIDDVQLRIAVGSGLGIPGYTLIVSATDAPTVWSKLMAIGAVPMGDRLWEQLRIQQGRPFPEQELTEDYNPLEAGLWHAISFDKGCYIGQETIARLNTYKGIKQRLWGVELSEPIAPGTSVTVDDSKVGILTSCTNTSRGAFGLAYIRTKAGGAGLEVRVDKAIGKLVAVPFLRHEYYQ
ncbi:folate-binding protein YgfZ [Pleurocapsales cyanobacterium LEGE 06147]|nr:folate-binding protein YgfZ [Pleurocapsales cyanobacterium LEGE 06147]